MKKDLERVIKAGRLLGSYALNRGRLVVSSIADSIRDAKEEIKSDGEKIDELLDIIEKEPGITPSKFVDEFKSRFGWSDIKDGKYKASDKKRDFEDIIYELFLRLYDIDQEDVDFIISEFNNILESNPGSEVISESIREAKMIKNIAIHNDEILVERFKKLTEKIRKANVG